MNKIILGGLVLAMTISFAGCGKSKEEKTLDKFTSQMEDVSKNVDKEMKQLNKEMEKQGAAMGEAMKEQENMMKKQEKTTKEKLEETKNLKKCLVKASSKNQALGCYGDLEGEDFTNNEAAAMNTGIREWTAEDKAQVLNQTDMLIGMIEMQVQ